MVASDLEAYGPVDQVGDATALRILVIQYCDDSAVECEERAAAFVSTWEGRGAAVRVVRPEDAAAEIATLVREV